MDSLELYWAVRQHDRYRGARGLHDVTGVVLDATVEGEGFTVGGVQLNTLELPKTTVEPTSAQET